MDKLLVTAEEAARLLGISRAQAYGMARRGELPSVRVGRLLRFSVDELERWVRERGGEAAESEHET